MKKLIINKSIVTYAIILTALVAAPISMRAQDQNSQKPEASETGSSAAKNHRHLPFHGKTAAVDKTAMTVKVGHMVINITSDTKITNNGKPATFSDIVVGEKISGSYQKDDSGKITALVIHIGDKAKGEGKTKNAEKPGKD